MVDVGMFGELASGLQWLLARGTSIFAVPFVVTQSYEQHIARKEI